MNAINDFGQDKRCGETFAQRLECWRQTARQASTSRPTTLPARRWLP